MPGGRKLEVVKNNYIPMARYLSWCSYKFFS